MTSRQTVTQLRDLAIAVTLLIALPGAFQPISAQIYEWIDNSGAQHFETSLQQIPEAERPNARVVVNAPTSRSVEETSDAGALTEAEPAADDNDGLGAFERGWDTGFEAGWDAGYRTAVEQQPECSAEPETVVLESRPPVVVNVPMYDPSGAYYRSPYDGAVSVPFDDGASRGLTRRNRIQEQRTLERGW